MNERKIAEAGILPSAILDIKDLHCPLSILFIKKEISLLSSGQTLQVNAFDAEHRGDIKGWCERSGNVFLGEREDKNIYCFFIKKR